MTVFGDTDPEDAWDDGDPYDVKVALLVRIAESIALDPDADRRRRRAVDAHRLLARLVVLRDQLDAELGQAAIVLDDG